MANSVAECVKSDNKLKDYIKSDGKLKECWVVVEDCLAGRTQIARGGNYCSSTYHIPEKRRTPLQISKISSSEDTISNTALKANHSKVSQFVVDPSQDRDSLVGNVVIRSKLFQENTVDSKLQIHKVKKPPFLWKSHKKRELLVASNSQTEADHVKHHLLQKYGRSLLRKPSFLVKTSDMPLPPLDTSQSPQVIDCHDKKICFSSNACEVLEGEGKSVQVEHGPIQCDDVSIPALYKTTLDLNQHDSSLKTEARLSVSLVKKAKSSSERDVNIVLSECSDESEEVEIECEKTSAQDKSLTKSTNAMSLKKDRWAATLALLRDKFSFRPANNNCKDIACYTEMTASQQLSKKIVSDGESVHIPVENKQYDCNKTNELPQVSSTKVLQDEVISDKNGKVLTNSSCAMPSVGMTVGVGVGHPLLPLQARCVLTCLDNCHNTMTPQYAQFCTAVVKTSPKTSTENVILPIEDKNILQFMKIKWNAQSAVKKIALSSLPDLKLDIASRRSMCMKACNEELSDLNSGRKKSPRKQCNEKATTHSSDSPAGVLKKTLPAGNNAGSELVNCVKRKHDLSWKQAQSEDTDQELAPILSNLDAGKEKVESEDLISELPRKRTKLTLLSADKSRSFSPSNLSDSIGKNSSSTGMSRSFKSNTNASEIPTAYTGDTEHCTSVLFDFPVPLYDPDDTRGVDGTEEIVEERTATPRNRPSHLMHELRRLNVAVFDMTNTLEPVVCKFPDICRLGCVCSSLSTKPVRDNCGLEQCMFGCSCLKVQTSHQENAQSYNWVQNKAKANLAKEERLFKRTVVRSGNDDLIVIEAKRKRAIKLPERFRADFVANGDLQAIRQFGSKSTTKPGVKEKENSDISFNQKKEPIKNSVLPSASTSTSLSNSVNDAFHDSSLTSKSNVKLPLEDQHPLKHLDPGTSARTIAYSFKSREGRQLKEKAILKTLTCEKVLTAGSSVGSKSLSKEGKLIDETVLAADSSCSQLFSQAFIQENDKRVVILSWDILRRDIDNKTVFIWLRWFNSKLKIYLTNKSLEPCRGCVELHSVDALNEGNLPFNLKTLRSDYKLGDSDKKCKWIVKYKKWCWIIVGFMEPGQGNRPISESEVDVLLPHFESNKQRWWVMDVNQSFDIIYFLEFKKAITKDQISTLLKLSNEYAEGEVKFHRILLNRSRPNIDPRPTPYPDFGAYSLPGRPTEVIIGPYEPCQEPRFQVYMEKVAVNGKAEYQKVPLVYCGAGECAKVNSNGVVSLHSENLPEKYVKGTWYHSYRGGSSKLQRSFRPECIDLTGADAQAEGMAPSEQVSQSLDSCSSGAEDDSSDRLSNTADEESGNVEANSTGSQTPTSSLGIDEEDSESDNEQIIHDFDNNQDVHSFEEGQELNVEYLVPCVKGIGVLTLTHLPNGVISVPHFTEPGLLKFFHNKKELINEINLLIHHKLACLSRKCSVYLRSSDSCKCVAWQSILNKKEIVHLHQFSPAVFNGFNMLTKYGLVDLRTADECAIQNLGKDWIEWLKNDEFRLKLSKWKKRELQNMNEKQQSLTKILTRSPASNLSLPQVLNLATQEIAKLKAEDQLLDYESQSQKLLKETLIYSFCRKLNGIPGTIVPKLLETLSLDVLWEVLECMESRNTHLLLEQKLASSLCLKPKESLLHQIDKDIEQDISKMEMKTAGISQQIREQYKLQQQYQLREHLKQSSHHELQDKTRTHQYPAEDTTCSPQGEEGLVCHLSPFARVNISVEESGIKQNSLHSPPSTKVSHTSPGKPPNILRRSKSLYGDSQVTADSSENAGAGSVQQKHARRKQTFSCSTDNQEEPVFVEDSVLVDRGSSETTEATSISDNAFPKLPIGTDLDKSNSLSPSTSTALVLQTDPMPSLQISSVLAGASALHNAATQKSNVASSSSPTYDPVSSLRISSVVSRASLLHDAAPEILSPVKGGVDPSVIKIIPTPSSSSGVVGSNNQAPVLRIVSSASVSLPNYVPLSSVNISARTPGFKVIRSNLKPIPSPGESINIPSQTMFLRPAVKSDRYIKYASVNQGNVVQGNTSKVSTLALPHTRQINTSMQNITNPQCGYKVNNREAVRAVETPPLQLSSAHDVAQPRTIKILKNGISGYITIPASSLKILPLSAVKKTPLLANNVVAINSTGTQKQNVSI